MRKDFSFDLMRSQSPLVTDRSWIPSHVMEDWIFGQNAALVPHPLRRNDLLHCGQVDDVVRSVQQWRHLMWVMAVLLSLLLLLLHHRLLLTILKVIHRSASRLLRNVVVGRLVLDLSALTPDAADLEVIPVGW